MCHQGPAQFMSARQTGRTLWTFLVPAVYKVSSSPDVHVLEVAGEHGENPRRENTQTLTLST